MHDPARHRGLEEAPEAATPLTTTARGAMPGGGKLKKLFFFGALAAIGGLLEMVSLMPAKRRLGVIAGVNEITSSSGNGNTRVTLQFDLNRNIDAAAQDVQAAVIAGRILQGAGAISAAVMAMAADLTRDEHRTKAMAMIGSTIAPGTSTRPRIEPDQASPV